MKLRMVIVFLLLLPSLLQAQTSPADLADLSLSELLQVEVEAEEQGWIFSYRFVLKDFRGYRIGTDDLSFEEMLELYPVVPTEIRQQAHLFELTRQTRDRFSWSVQIPLIEQSTDHIRRSGPDFNITTRGVGDVRVATTVEVGESWRLSAGVGLPTGSIDEKGDTPRGRGTQVPYTMQTGSGTWNFEPAASFVRNRGAWAWTAQLRGVIRFGRNDRDYSLGNRWLASAKVARRAGRVEPWMRLGFESWDRIDGVDEVLDPAIAPVADAALSGGERIDASVGLRWTPGGFRHALEIEAGTPVYQDLNGPQPKRRWEVVVGWRFSL